MTPNPIDLAYAVFHAATPVIKIDSVGGSKWKRNVAKGARIGPWLPAKYDVLNKSVWEARNPCLYLVAGRDGVIRYVGISRNRLKDRWRVSPAHDAETMVKLSQNQLFHSQCWKHIERESAADPSSSYEVRCIDGHTLLPLLEKLGPPLSAFAALRGDGEGIVAGIERWMCNNRGPRLVSWNVAMTARAEQTMLNAEELKHAQRLISAAAPGVYELKTLYGAEWPAVASPTSFGKRFRQSVLGRQLKNIRPDSTRGDNHKLYQVG